MKQGTVLKQGFVRSLAIALVVVFVGAVPVSVWAQGAPLAPGAAHGTGEAPGGGSLAQMPAENAAPATDANDPAAQRGMSFSAGGGQCRDTVPGGTLLAVAYAIAIAVMGAYVAFLAYKNSQLTRSIESLEAQIAKRTGGSKTDDA